MQIEELPIERTKEMVEWAIECGRKLQSPQTKLVHYHYQSRNQGVQHAIPILENVLFALGLLRSRLMENITEAKEILSRLLAFQNLHTEESKGNFPIYLHDFPKCWDSTLGIILLAPLYWILKLFGHILGNDLKTKLEHALRALLTYSLQLQKQKTLSYSIAVRLSAAKIALGHLWSQKEFVQEGEKELAELQQRSHVESWHMTSYLSDVLVALQMVYPSIKQSPWKEFWKYLSQTWHRQACCYIGPNIKEEQVKDEPAISLYDFYLGYFSKQYSNRARAMHPCHLSAVLIQPSEDVLDPIEFPFELNGNHKNQPWFLRHQQDHAFTVLEKRQAQNSPQDQNGTPFQLIWGSPARAHSFVLQGTNCLVHSQIDGDTIDLFFQFEKEGDVENREKQREINFYLDYHAETEMTIEEKACSSFELGQTVTIQSDQKKFSIRFDLLEGQGQFWGHFMRSNRPSQVDTQGSNRFNSYDWHLFIRTIRREPKCLLRARIQLL